MESSENNSNYVAGWSIASRNYIVTGGTKGIGYATARSLLSHGANVLLCARTASDIETCVKTLRQEFKNGENDTNSRIHGIACDISKDKGRNVLYETTVQIFQSELHGLINNVGKNIRKPLTEQTHEEYHSIQTTNVDSIYFLCRIFQPLLAQTAASSQTYSTVVNVASAAGVQSSGTGAAYGMSKASIIHFTKILACEWAKYKIRVNAVAPWMTMTPMLEDAIKQDPTQLDKVMDWTPMKRLATVEEVAGPIVFLCMECSGYMTGQCLGVDGGLTAQGFDGPCASEE